MYIVYLFIRDFRYIQIWFRNFCDIFVFIYFRKENLRFDCFINQKNNFFLVNMVKMIILGDVVNFVKFLIKDIFIFLSQFILRQFIFLVKINYAVFDVLMQFKWNLEKVEKNRVLY